MPTIDHVVESKIDRSFRVEQVAGRFDFHEKIARERFQVELPELSEDWTIGAIVGPSGSGKSTIAQKAYGNDLVTRFRWPKNQALIDGFDEDLSGLDVVRILSAVGFSSTPSWMKPYHVLSNGEKMRCDLARAIASKKKLIVFDEFTSVVDRQVAKAASFALAKHLRRKRAKRFIAVTCHYDVLDWLQPDWTLDMATQELARGCLRRRPPITFQVARVHHSAWELFRKHHYLNHGMSQAARCFVAFWDEHPVSFCAVLDLFHKQKKWLVTRWVTLPDYQGLGIGLELLERTAAWMGTYKPFSIRSSHPAVISTLHRSPHWAMRQVVKPIGTSEKRPDFRVSRAGLRVTASFEYVGPLGDRREARRVMDAKPKPFLLPEDTRRALEVVRQTPGVTVPVIAGRLGVSRDRVRSGLESLRRSGEVIRKGVGRGPSPFAYYPEEFAS